MSWLYTIIFAGLMFSSNGSGTAVNTDSIIQNTDKPEEVRNLDETEKFGQTYPLNANGRVSLSNVNGSITVEAWDRNEVKLEYVKTADSKERLADVEIKIDSKPEYFSIETKYDWKTMNNSGQWKNHGNLQVDYHLSVPRGAVLNELETVNGSVTVSNFVNFTKVSAVNGSVNAANLRGTANLSTVNGEVAADFDQLEIGSKITLTTVNGRVNLVIPSDSNATLKADSLNGNISNDFGLPVRKGKYIGRDMYGRIGSGEVKIRLSSVNGGLSIGRKNDGKNASPATNLLPQKEKDDEDWDKNDNGDSPFQSAKVNKEIAKAVKESAKVSATAVKEAQKEINRIQPEIAKITADSISRAADAIVQTAEVLSSADFKEKIKEAATKQKDVWASIADAAYVYVPAATRIEKKSDSFPVKGVPKVTVEAKGCGVRIHGWDRSEVQYSVTQFSSGRNRTPMKIKEDHSESAVNIKIENPDGNVGNGNFYNELTRVRIEVFVPRKSNLKISADGEIRLEGVSGDVDLSGYDESINVRDGDGTLRVSSSDGRIRVIGFKGEITAETSDGMVYLEGDFRKLKARANDGAIYLTLLDKAQADIEATSSEIHSEGIELTRISGDEKLSKYRIGNGGATFQIETEGEIHIRSASSLKTSF